MFGNSVAKRVVMLYDVLMSTATCTVGPSAVTGERCGAPAVTNDGEFPVCADHALPFNPHRTVEQLMTPRVSIGRGKLTPHQREVHQRLFRRSARGAVGVYSWVPVEEIGSRTALKHLVRKGWAEERVEYGPRGGERLSYKVVVAS